MKSMMKIAASAGDLFNLIIGKKTLTPMPQVLEKYPNLLTR
jgi:hypothetical protein